jgi:hypothetical protein
MAAAAIAASRIRIRTAGSLLRLHRFITQPPPSAFTSATVSRASAPWFRSFVPPARGVAPVPQYVGEGNETAAIAGARYVLSAGRGGERLLQLGRRTLTLDVAQRSSTSPRPVSTALR